MAAVPTDFLVSKIVSLLENETALLGGACDQLEEIKHELVSMRSFLEDSDKKRPQEKGEKTWVAEVRDLVYDVEDIIDEALYRESRRQGRRKAARYLLRTIGIPKDLWEKHQLATRLQKIKNTITAIPDRNKRYGVDQIQSSERDSVILHGESSFFLKDDELVGIEDERELLVGWLTRGETQRTTISVVGMGGSGKTTLVAKAYNCQTVKHYFDCCAWITVSRTYLIEELFRSLIKQFYQAVEEAVPTDLSTLSYKQLVETLVNCLEQKKYVVVLDDVWDADLWNQIKVALPNSRRGCRVIITTRNEGIASLSFGVGSHVHSVKPLEKKEAWTLFCTRAFSRNASICPSELEILAKDIVEKCQGLPLAVVALGGLLSTKSSESEWRMVYNCLNWELSNNPMLQAVKSILLLSYNDLPYRLKNCFLYCCFFPEDYSVKRKKLIRLWIAEGFVENVRGVTPEELAEQYLLELIRRSMLQVVERNSFGLPKACQMHDLLRELVLTISEEEKFAAVLDKRRGGSREDCVARRLSVQASEIETQFCKDMSKLRSLFLFVNDIPNQSSLDLLLSRSKLLRVLDLEDAPIENLPDDLGTLFNLRYLNLKGAQVKKLPKSIGRLLNLETLNIDKTKIEALPSVILNLQNLRYLLMRRLNHGMYYDFNYVSGIRVPSKISNLKNLQVLGCIEAYGDVLRQVKNMTQLVRLEISEVKGSDEVDLCSSIKNMPHLRRLFVMASKDETLHMDALKSPPPHLGRLSLVGKLVKIPQWFDSLQSLRVLYLRWSRLSEDPLSNLQALPNLRWLVLVRAYEGTWLEFSGGFQNLEILEVHNCPELLCIWISKGVMPGVKAICIGNCPMMKTLPQGIQYLTDLQELTLINASEEVIDIIHDPISDDRLRVQHIPKINNVYFSSSGWSQESIS